jgi:cytoskeleton protein RodZ
MSQGHAQNQSTQQNWESYTDMPVGEILRRTRQHYGQSLTDVEGILRIRAVQLQALEDGRIDLLPGRVYAIGFVRAYAEYLGLDGEKMVHLFKVQAGNPPRPRAELHFPVPASESKVPNYYILGSSVAGVIVVIAALILTAGGMKKETATVPSVPSELRAEALVSKPAPQLAQVQPALVGPVIPGMPTTVSPVAAIPGAVAPVAALPGVDPALVAAAASAAENPELVIRVLDTAWVEVRDEDGQALLSRVLKPGDSYTVPPAPGMTLDTGNIGGLEFVLNGTTLPPLGAKGDVRRKVSLDPAKLQPVQPKVQAQSVTTGAAAAAIAPAAGGTVLPADPALIYEE